MTDDDMPHGAIKAALQARLFARAASYYQAGQEPPPAFMERVRAGDMTIQLFGVYPAPATGREAR